MSNDSPIPTVPEQERQMILAQTIATVAHRGQTDKANVPYLHHPKRVASLVQAHGGTMFQVAAAWLHDVIEDTEFTYQDLTDMGVHPNIIEMVHLLTRTEDISKEIYYARIKDSRALIVKACDILDNSDLQRLRYLDADTVGRLVEKYASALTALGLSGPSIDWKF